MTEHKSQVIYRGQVVNLPGTAEDGPLPATVGAGHKVTYRGQGGRTFSVRKALIAYSVVVLTLISALAAGGLMLLREANATRAQGEALAASMLVSSRALADVGQAVSYLRDISLTGNLDSAAKAREKTSKARAMLREGAWAGDAGRTAALGEKIAEVQRLGAEMAHTYLSKGREAGKRIMYREGTGFEVVSSEVIAELSAISGETRDRLRANAEALELGGQKAQRNIVAVSIASLLLVPIITILLYRKLVGPVGKMVDVVNLVADGDDAARCGLHTRDELQLLGDAFDRLLDERLKQMGHLQETTEALDEEKRRLSRMETPVTQIWDGILFLPLVGTVDAKRAQDIMDIALPTINETQARALIIDISGVPVVDTSVADYLIKVTRAAVVMGCDCTISGISPAVAHTIIDLGIDVGQMKTTAKLQDAIADAYSQRGLKVAARG